MLFSLLFLSLVPVALMAESFSDFTSPSDEDDPNGAGHGYGEEDTQGNGDFLSPDEETGILYPNTDDQEIPDPPDENDPNAIQPNSGLGNENSPHLDGTLLDQLLATETDANYGREDLPSFLQDQNEIRLSDYADNLVLDEDQGGDSHGQIDSFRGTPVLSEEGDSSIDVIDGGDGDDTLEVDTDAAYLFGNDGDDKITSGDGVMAAFGGEGSDVLDATRSADSFLDGGLGNDELFGGTGDDVLRGGVHTETADNLAGNEFTDDDILFGGDGDDTLLGGVGEDVLHGGDGDDVINHLGHAMEDSGAERHSFDWHLDGDKDVLNGGAGNDTLILDQADEATGGEGEDVFWLYAQGGAELDAAQVTDFVPGQDFLRISLDPTTDTNSLAYDVQPSENGEDGMVTVNGSLIAVLRGAPDASIHDIYVEITKDVFV